MRKGRLVGCKVTLRGEGLHDFLDLFILTTSRREKIGPSRGFIAKHIKNTVLNNVAREAKVAARAKAANLSTGLMSQTANGLIVPRKGDLPYEFPSFALTLGELVLFYPVEVGLGLHPDVKRVRINFIFSAYSFEEQFFLLRHHKVPVLS